VDAEREETITFLKHLMIAFPKCDTNAIGVRRGETVRMSSLGDGRIWYQPQLCVGLYDSGFRIRHH